VRKEDAEEFTQSLGQIVGGSWRQIALAERLGVPSALGLKTKEWVNERLGGYVKLTAEERFKAYSELTAEGHSKRSIARITGAGRGTVVRDTGPNGPLKPTSKSGRTRDTGPNGPLDAVAALAATGKVRSAAKALDSRQRREDERAADLKQPFDGHLPEGVHFGDFRELATAIPEGSIDLVFTDPPYNESSIPLYAEAARIAARVLKQNGSLIAYSGQKYLPQVLAGMSPFLRYWWTCAGIHEGGNQILEKLGVRCGWKPLVWFVKGTRGIVSDVLLDTVRGDREKDAHEWQQAVSEARYFIERLCPAGGTVVDFFIGGGTTRVAAEQLGRKFIGFEVAESALQKALERWEKVA
jgi:DNA methylase